MHSSAEVLAGHGQGIHVVTLQLYIDTVLLRLGEEASLRAPKGGFVHAGFQDHLGDLTTDRDGDIKVTCLKESKYGAEPEAHIELAVPLFGIVTAEALREGTGIESGNMYCRLADLHRGDTCTLTGPEAAQLPPIASGEENRYQNNRNRQRHSQHSFQ